MNVTVIYNYTCMNTLQKCDAPTLQRDCLKYATCTRANTVHEVFYDYSDSENRVGSVL